MHSALRNVTIKHRASNRRWNAMGPGNQAAGFINNLSVSNNFYLLFLFLDQSLSPLFQQIFSLLVRRISFHKKTNFNFLHLEKKKAIWYQTWWWLAMVYLSHERSFSFVIEWSVLISTWHLFKCVHVVGLFQLFSEIVSCVSFKVDKRNCEGLYI